LAGLEGKFDKEVGVLKEGDDRDGDSLGAGKLELEELA
jgi:hypothetical protein